MRKRERETEREREKERDRQIVRKIIRMTEVWHGKNASRGGEEGLRE